MRRVSTWSPVRTADGSWTARHPDHGEACHDTDGAWREARERYAVPCRIRERARQRSAGVLRLLDVGTGLGWNVSAALAAVDGTGTRLECVTLERDPRALATALDLPRAVEPAAAEVGGGGDLAGAERHHARVRAALARCLERPEHARVAELGDGGSLTLLLGDARRAVRELFPGPTFDAVFLDPFSPAREPELWEPDFLAEVARRMAPGSLLSTYSVAFRVRLGLARAGLEVGAGPPVGRKREGTLASPDLELPPLRPRVAKRLGRALLGASGAVQEPILRPERRERPAAID